MNDFTKEELIVIEDGIGHVRHKSIEFRTALLRKIDAMIDDFGMYSNKDTARLHLNDAVSLIHDATRLLGLDE